MDKSLSVLDKSLNKDNCEYDEDTAIMLELSAVCTLDFRNEKSEINTRKNNKQFEVTNNVAEKSRVCLGSKNSKLSPSNSTIFTEGISSQIYSSKTTTDDSVSNNTDYSLPLIDFHSEINYTDINKQMDSDVVAMTVETSPLDSLDQLDGTKCEPSDDSDSEMKDDNSNQPKCGNLVPFHHVAKGKPKYFKSTTEKIRKMKDEQTHSHLSNHNLRKYKSKTGRMNKTASKSLSAKLSPNSLKNNSISMCLDTIFGVTENDSDTNSKNSICDKSSTISNNRSSGTHSSNKVPPTCKDIDKQNITGDKIIRKTKDIAKVKRVPPTIFSKLHCPICLRKFSQQNCVQLHITTHTNERAYKCEICLSSFKDRCTFRKHQLIHTGKKPFECDICGWRFTQKGNIKKHITKHTANLTTDGEYLPFDKQYLCNFCTNTYADVNNFNCHMSDVHDVKCERREGDYDMAIPITRTMTAPTASQSTISIKPTLHTNSPGIFSIIC